MISFRFHLASIVAVFLALAVGIVIGSTLIDRAIVDGLRNRVDRVSENLDDRLADNEALSEELGELDAWVDEVGPTLVEGRMENAVTVVVTDRGVDDSPVNATTDLLEQSGATVRGVVTLEESWTLEDAETRDELAAELNLTGDETVEEIQERAASLLVADLASAVEVVGDDAGALDAMVALDLVDYEQVSDVVAGRRSAVHFVLVSGPESDLGSSDHLADFADAALQVTSGVVAAEVHAELEEGPERGTWLAPIREEAPLAQQVATVDDLDLPPGPATVVVALADASEGIVGHYGFGNGADAAVPVPPEEP
jgi:hypothetical protein